MTRITFLMLTLGLSLAPVLCWAVEPGAEQAKAIAEIEKLGGKVTRDKMSPGRPVISVEFKGNPLFSPSFPSIDDALLANLKGLTTLQSLDLRDSKVTNAGVQKLQRVLPNCHIHHDEY